MRTCPDDGCCDIHCADGIEKYFRIKRAGPDLACCVGVLVLQGVMIEISRIEAVGLLWQHSPLLRGAARTLEYMIDNGPIPLTPRKALTRRFVQWAAEVFDWPGFSVAELYAVNKVLNEADFPPLVVLHELLVSTKLARHYKDTLVITKQGRALANAPSQLWQLLVDVLLWQTDHGRYMRHHFAFDADWLQVLEVLNVAAHEGASEVEICAELLGIDEAEVRRDFVTGLVFYMFVLRPLSWAGLLAEARADSSLRAETMFVKTPLWPLAWRFASDELLPKIIVH